MGDFPKNISEQKLYDMLICYIKDEKYIAVYTNNKKISEFLQKFKCLTYHEDFAVAYISEVPEIDKQGIRLATMSDLPFIEKTYGRAKYNQLLNRVRKEKIWVMEDNNEIKGYVGIHKDCSLGFEYVVPKFRRQHIGSRMQFFVAEQMMKKNMLPYVMISVENDMGINLQKKLGSHFAEKLFYFFAKGEYEYE